MGKQGLQLPGDVAPQHVPGTVMSWCTGQLSQRSPCRRDCSWRIMTATEAGEGAQASTVHRGPPPYRLPLLCRLPPHPVLHGSCQPKGVGHPPSPFPIFRKNYVLFFQRELLCVTTKHWLCPGDTQQLFLNQKCRQRGLSRSGAEWMSADVTWKTRALEPRHGDSHRGN